MSLVLREETGPRCGGRGKATYGQLLKAIVDLIASVGYSNRPDIIVLWFFGATMLRKRVLKFFRETL